MPPRPSTHLSQSSVVVIADDTPPYDRRRQTHRSDLSVDGAGTDRKPEADVSRRVPALAQVDDVEKAEECERQVDVTGVELALTEVGQGSTGGTGGDAAPGRGGDGDGVEEGEGKTFQVRFSLNRTTERIANRSLL